MDSDADDLLLFARVMEVGSFSRAAQRVGWPKSTVSRRMAGLERRLGEKLLQRSTRRLTLTDFGEGVLEHAKALAAEVDGALTLALHRQQRPSGRLRVSMPGDLGQSVIGEVLTRYVLDHPDVQLELDFSPRRVDLIAEGFDLAVRMGELGQDSQLAARRLGTFGGSLYAAPAYLDRCGEPLLPQALEDMHALMLLSRNAEAMSWRLSRGEGAALEHWSGLPTHRTLANTPLLLRQLAEAGVGIVGLDDFMAEPAVRAGRLVPVLPDWRLPAVDCWAVFPDRRLMPLRTRLFLEALQARLGAEGGLCPTRPR